MASRAQRDFVTGRAGSHCEDCRAPEIITGAAYHLEHIVPRHLYGTDDIANYALSCITCNGHKSGHTTGIDPATQAEFPLFNPRKERWDRHFRFLPATLQIQGLTPKARATVARLQMNERKQIEARRLWVELEIYPQPWRPIVGG
jgi:hypothetical protein